MDQKKTGKFIQTLRKEKNLTQKELADKLLITDKTVSKWETGKGLPEVSLMLPLCEILGISVNELLTGEKLDQTQYVNKAEENILGLVKEGKKRFILFNLSAIIIVVYTLTLMLIAAFVPMQDWIRIFFIALAFVLLIPSIILLCYFDRESGSFECKHCGHRFTPTFKAYIFGAHTITRRKLKCPNCHKKSWCIKRMYK